jgi:hypothetical protein
VISIAGRSKALTAVGSSAEVDEAADDGQLDLPSGGHGGLPSGIQRDYFV